MWKSVKSILRIILFACIVCVFGVGLCGCTRMGVNVDRIIEMYNKKYDDKFTFLSGGYALWNDNYEEFFLTSAKLDNAAINIRVYESGSIRRIPLLRNT